MLHALILAWGAQASSHQALAQAAPAGLTPPPFAISEQIRAGMPLAQALEILRGAGLELLYSSQLVRDELLVLSQPRPAAPSAMLAEILAPHGLEARSTEHGQLVIVRAGVSVSTQPAVPGITPDDRPLGEVTVHASRYELHRDAPSSVTVMDRRRLDAMPGVEQDVIRSLQRIPGSASSGLSATTHVRGSYDDEVQIRFDGVNLYEPFHFKDFLNLFGALDPELIDTVDLYSGGFPVDYGERAAGVLDIHPRRTQGHAGLIGASVLNNRLISSGSHSAERGEWLVGYRSSNLAAVIRQLDRDVGEPQFEDLLLRYAYRITPNLRAAAGLLTLEDDHVLRTLDRSEQARAGYSDDAAWLRLDYESGENWAIGLHAAHSHLSARRDGTGQREGVSSGMLSEDRVATIDNVRLTWAWRMTQRLHWRGGVDLTRGEAEYDYRADAVFQEPLASAFGRSGTLSQRVDTTLEGDAIAPWLAARTEMGAATLDIGVRFDERGWIDGDGQWSPRASLRYDLGESTVLRVSAGRYLQSQSVNELEVEAPVPVFAPPEDSRQLIVGLEQRLPAEMRLRVEAFDRQMRATRPRFENLLDPLALLPEIEVDRVRVAPQSSRARGVEVTLLSDSPGELSWWGSYTWSRSSDRFGGGEAARSWDQRNALTIGAAWRARPWLLSAVAGYVSGWPFTDLRFEGPPAADTSGFSSASLGPRNRQRFEDRLLLDLRAQYSLALPRGEVEFVLDVRNAATRGNECCRDVEITSLPDGTYAADVRERKWLGLVPILGINWRF